MGKCHVLAVALTAALAAAAVSSSPALASTTTATAHATSIKTVSARHLLAGLPVRAESHSRSFEPTKFASWVDADHNGDNTRTEVLRATSMKRVTTNAHGSVKTGKWMSTNDGKVYTDASKLRIQNVVSLREAWASGAYKWSPRKRSAYRNDLGYGPALSVVAKGAERSKRDRRTTAARCSSVRNIIAVKSRWHLSVDAAEKASLGRDLRRYCVSVAVQKPTRPHVANLLNQRTAAAPSPGDASDDAIIGPPTGGSTPVAAPAPAPSKAPAATTPPAPVPLPFRDPAMCVSGPTSGRTLQDLFGSEQPMTGRTFVIGGLGSSVGVGATVPATDAPVAYFATRLARQVDPARLARWTTVNGSVNGSTIHNGRTRDWAVLERSHPDVVVLAYGMNDGMPSQFESGETYDGAMRDLCALVSEIRSSGAVPVLLTTPSAHTTRSDWDYLVGPRYPQHSPVDTSSPVRVVRLPGRGSAPESTRHAAVNAGIRSVASSLHVDLVDVEPYWLIAVASRGEDALFNASQSVHPNLLGHRLSYHYAIDAALAQL